MNTMHRSKTYLGALLYGKINSCCVNQTNIAEAASSM